MLPNDTEAAIVRLYHAECWKIGTIARQLHVHRDAVRRVLSAQGLVVPERLARPSMVDPYIPFIRETLAKYPTLRASRLFHMVKARGYPGASDHFRGLVARHRPRPPSEAYLRLRTLPGDQAQVDWAHFGKLMVGKTERRLLAFVMVLSYSRRMYIRFYLGDATDNFLRGHVAAFEHFGACPREILYDNLKSAVLERRGQAIHFNPTLLALASHYRFEPKPVAVARGNEKGRVERAIQYCRHAFFAARSVLDLATLNAEVLAWCDAEARERRCPGDTSMSVAQAFVHERALLLPLPPDAFPTDERVAVHVGKTPYIRFDGNDYSVPHIHVRRTLQVVASLAVVRVFDGVTQVASHPRTFEKDRQIEEAAHVEELVEFKRNARRARGMDYLHEAVPSSDGLFKALGERGGNLGAMTTALVSLLDLYGAEALERAVVEAVAAGVLHKAGIRQVLDRDRPAPPPIAVRLPDDPRVRELVVKPHALDTYDGLAVAPEVSA